ncbi:MAG: hypothetical protein JW955_13035 [Sedimentisphaerales bacterium]|nr:hypothetical protein [Sedimentisphaerales bacterium]
MNSLRRPKARRRLAASIGTAVMFMILLIGGCGSKTDSETKAYEGLLDCFVHGSYEPELTQNIYRLGISLGPAARASIGEAKERLLQIQEAGRFAERTIVASHQRTQPVDGYGIAIVTSEDGIPALEQYRTYTLQVARKLGVLDKIEQEVSPDSQKIRAKQAHLDKLRRCLAHLMENIDFPNDRDELEELYRVSIPLGATAVEPLKKAKDSLDKSLKDVQKLTAKLAMLEGRSAPRVQEYRLRAIQIAQRQNDIAGILAPVIDEAAWARGNADRTKIYEPQWKWEGIALPEIDPQAGLPPESGVGEDATVSYILADDVAGSSLDAYAQQLCQMFHLYNTITIEVRDEKSPEGPFNPETLANVHQLAIFAGGLRWPQMLDDRCSLVGVIGQHVLAPSTVERIERDGPDTVAFSPLLEHPPHTSHDVTEFQKHVLGSPVLEKAVVSSDKKSLYVHMPIAGQGIRGVVQRLLAAKIGAFSGPETYGLYHVVCGSRWQRHVDDRKRISPRRVFLVLDGRPDENLTSWEINTLRETLLERARELEPTSPRARPVFQQAAQELVDMAGSVNSRSELMSGMTEYARTEERSALSRAESTRGRSGVKSTADAMDEADLWNEVADCLSLSTSRNRLFATPAAVKYIAEMTKAIVATDRVESCMCVADLVKQAYGVIVFDDPVHAEVPGSQVMITQCVALTQNSRRAYCLGRFVTSDYTKTSIHILLRREAAADVESIMRAVKDFLKRNEPPFPMKPVLLIPGGT